MATGAQFIPTAFKQIKGGGGGDCGQWQVMAMTPETFDANNFSANEVDSTPQPFRSVSDADHSDL
jgi:hypothetical protein